MTILKKNIPIAVSIVNYRTADLVIDCLHSLFKEYKNPHDFKVYVVDNKSNDDSFQIINSAVAKYKWKEWVKVFEAPKNGGFSYGNNIAIKENLNEKIQAKYVYLLNPDTVIHSNALNKLIDFMETHADVGICGGAIIDQNSTIQHSARRFPSYLSELESSARLGVLSEQLKNHTVPFPNHNQAHACDWVSGASMLIRAEIFNKIGLMDENYFLYFEELDYCYFAKKAGYEVFYVPDSIITHIEGASTGVNKKQRRGQYWYDSRRRYFLKTSGIKGLILADVFWALGRLSFNIRKALRLGKNFSHYQDPTWFAWDLLIGDVKAAFTGQVLRINKEYGPK